MPNWVYNTLTIEGDEQTIAEIKTRLAQPYDTHYPDSVYDKEKQEWVRTPATQTHESPLSFWNITQPVDKDAYYAVKALPTTKERTTAEIFADIQNDFRVGMDWYNWNVRNWGCKWDASNVRVGQVNANTITYNFDTPWSPPAQAIIKLSEQYPEADIALRFEEEQGWGGVVHYKAGAEEIVEQWDVPSCHADYDKLEQDCWACSYPYKDDKGNWVGLDSLFEDCPRDFLEEK
jgi:Ferredoxin-like domain in Api92-like protein